MNAINNLATEQHGPLNIEFIAEVHIILCNYISVKKINSIESRIPIEYYV